MIERVEEKQSDVRKAEASGAAVCWLCTTNPADTGEHSVKASDLISRYGGRQWSANTAPVLVTASERARRIQGPNSALVKFANSLCARCNNQRTQPYDRAYEVFSDYLLVNRVMLGRGRELRFDRIYGASYTRRVIDLIAYFMKTFGCAMMGAGITPPQEFVARIGKVDAAPFYVTIAINETVRQQLNCQSFAPLHVEWERDGSAYGVMMNGMFEIRMWWKVAPHRRSYGTVFSGPVKKIVMREVPWGSSTAFHIRAGKIK